MIALFFVVAVGATSWDAPATWEALPSDGSMPITSKWDTLSSMPTARHTVQMVTLPDGTGVVVGGSTDSTATGSHGVSGKMERFTLSTGKWDTLSSIPTPRENHASVFWKGKIYVMGGLAVEGTAGGGIDLVEAYDIVSKTWSNTTALPKKLTGVRAAVLPDNSGILIAGGFVYPFTSTSYQSDSYIFDGKSWTKTKGSLPWGRSNMGMVTAHKSGSVFAIGGSATHPSYNGVARFDMASQMWHSAANLTNARCYFGLVAATDKIDGQEYLYAIAGMDDHFSPLSDVERYSVATDEWSEYDELPIDEGGVAASVLMNATQKLMVVAGGTYTFSHAV
jgi:N-acetylneuraminic acid mutarotase